MAYVPRLTAPSNTDKHWISTAFGGYNKCIIISGKSVLPNCVGYAYGRFMEIMGKTSCNLPTANGGDWYNSCTAYSKGKTPKLGAVLCMSGGSYGHVAIVEEIHTDGSITVSESSYNGTRWRLSTFTKANGYAWPNSGYWYQGFIYNPAVSGSTVPIGNKTKDFIDEAIKHNGQDSTWVDKTCGKHINSWCGAFIIAVAKTVGGLIGKVIPNTSAASEIPRSGVQNNLGKFIKGPHWGKSVTPQPGDLILFRWKDKSVYKTVDKYASDHIGIVTEVKKNKIYVVDGDFKQNDKVATHEYNVKFTCINGYYRPNWETVEGDPESTSIVNTGPLYDHKNDRNDACMREVCYCDSKGEPSIKSTDIKLSVINYTSVFGAIYEALGGSATSEDYSSDSVDTSGIQNKNAKVIANYLLDKGLSAAQMIGILANIQQESNFNPAAVNASSGASGICQWMGSRKTAMIQSAGSGWKNNLSGQCEYLWHELNGSENATLKSLTAEIVTNTESAAMDAADIVLKKFERPGNYSIESPIRRRNAKKLWSQIVIQRGDTNGKIVTQSGKIITDAAKVVTVPSSVNQSGVTGNYTNYSYFYGRWARSSIQYKLAEEWAKQGKPSKRNIATISGYYLLAMTPKFGTTGDILTIVLKDGTQFNAIMGDSKGADASSEWGHFLGDQVDVIEWEKKGNPASNVDNATKIDLSGWQGKKVAKVYNYGTWLR